MRIILLFISLLCVASSLSAQDTLYYCYEDKDSTMVGVRNQKGEIVISPIQTFVYHDCSIPIAEETIDFEGSRAPFEGIKNSPVIPIGSVYNRKGEYLYSAQFYDNGMDYWREGLRRYVENNKIGFVNRSGDKVLPAKWDFVTPFHYGYAIAFEGKLSRAYDASGEHWNITGDTAQHLINTKGELVKGYAKVKYPKDYFYNNKYYPYPFSYSKKEKEILSSFEEDIVGISFLFDSNKHQYVYSPVQLEIIGRPNNLTNHYVISVFDNVQSQIYDCEIYVNASSDKRHITDYQNNKTPLQEAIVKQLIKFLDSGNEDILPETRKIAEQELQRLKAIPRDGFRIIKN